VVGFQLAPIVISLLVLGAHFLRAGNALLVLLVLVLVAMLGVRRRWSARLVQAALVLGAVEWIRTLLTLAAARAANREPMLRMVLILGGVTLVTVSSALIFRSGWLRQWFDPKPEARDAKDAYAVAGGGS
jgi:hypothetical protein